MKPRPPSSTGTATLLPYTTLFRSEAEAAGGRGLAHVADVTDPAAVDGMVAATLAAFGRIDFLVSNAALRRQTPFLEMAFDDWREILSVALDGAFVLSKVCAPHMIAAGGGAIVTIGGISTHVGKKDRKSTRLNSSH